MNLLPSFKLLPCRLPIALAGFLGLACTAMAQEPSPPTAPSENWIEVMGLEQILGQNSLKNWLILLLMVFIGVAGGKLISVLLQRMGTPREGEPARAYRMLMGDGAGPANLAFFTICLQVGLTRIIMQDALVGFTSSLITLLLYTALFWYAFNLVGLVDGALKKLTAKTESELDDMLAPMVRKTLRIFIVILAFLLIAENVFGQDIGAWLAGLGIAGLAFSLAAQDSIKNLFGSLTIVLDRPFKVGDRVAYAGFDGPVEEIGFRSTKIRTLTGHLVTVPNSRIVNDPVENIGARPCIRRIMNVTITYDTPPEKIVQAVQIVRDILEEPGIAEPIHGRIGDDEFPPRVYFNDFNAASLNIIVIYWFFPPAYWDFLEHCQQINEKLFKAYGEAGIDFAFPTQTLYLAGDEKRELAMRMLGPGPDLPG